MITLPIARYRFDCVTHEDLRLPDFAGSTLRGQFGAALRELSCITRARKCEGCTLTAHCPYTTIFEPLPAESGHGPHQSKATPGYIMEPPEGQASSVAANGTWSFHIVLIGRSLGQLPLIIMAVKRLLLRGLGPRRVTGTLVAVSHQRQDGRSAVIHDENQPGIAAHDATIALPAPGTPLRAALLNFHTPVRLAQPGNHPRGRNELTAHAMLIGIARRVALVCQAHVSGWHTPDFQAMVRQAETLDATLRMCWRDYTRYSSRQKQAMTLGGLTGEWHTEGNLSLFHPWLVAGQWLHVGKLVPFGFGRYTLTPDIAWTNTQKDVSVLAKPLIFNNILSASSQNRAPK